MAHLSSLSLCVCVSLSQGYCDRYHRVVCTEHMWVCRYNTSSTVSGHTHTHTQMQGSGRSSTQKYEGWVDKKRGAKLL